MEAFRVLGGWDYVGILFRDINIYSLINLCF